MTALSGAAALGLLGGAAYRRRRWSADRRVLTGERDRVASRS